ncbi:tetratricopeptide repeat protein, partial [bacterium]|nr:tetratricopeptide repeat protein [bacterium]
DETLYVQDYFLQSIDISIPEKTEIRLHKYIIGIYEKELKESLRTRSITISRQALRAEIEYHKNCIEEIKNGKKSNEPVHKAEEKSAVQEKTTSAITESLENKLKEAQEYFDKENYTKSIEEYLKIIDTEELDSGMLNEIRHKLGIIYKNVADYTKAQHYYELVEKYFKYNNEIINLNYLYYELTELYHVMYKNERAIETIKKVIYSVDTPQSLMVDACTLLGNLYSELDNSEEAYAYYQKALESLDENTSEATLAELYFKYALANDDRGDSATAFEYYNKCISSNDTRYKSSAYSNLGSCYYENNNFSDSKACFLKAYEIEKNENNYDGIYYIAINLANIFAEEKSTEALKYLLEAKQSAEFLNENSYLLEVSIMLGDYYYNDPNKHKEALIEYLKAKSAAENMPNADISKIEKRIKDMKLRMDEGTFEEIVKNYEK